jgi:protease-4
VGEFKSAVEPFTRTEQSPEARAANQALADALWATWQDDVRRARPKAQIAAYIAAPTQAAAAAAAGWRWRRSAPGLVDTLGDRVAFGRRVATLAGVGPGENKEAGSYRDIPLNGWFANHAEPSSGAAIGVVTVAGNIVDGKTGPAAPAAPPSPT